MTIRNIAFRFLPKDLHEMLSDRRICWLTVSLLLYFIILPFNAFGFYAAFPFARLFKYTEIALLLVIIFSLDVYLRRKIELKRAWWLYGFLLLQAVAQFTSLFGGAPDLRLGIDVAISVASYSILVFVLVNVINSQAQLRVILGLMTATLIYIIIRLYILYARGSGALNPEHMEQVLGNGVPHYLAYALLMYGAALTYFFLKGARLRWVRNIILLAIITWMQLTALHAVKISQLATLFFLVLVVLFAQGSRKKAFALVGLYLIIFWIRFNIVTVKNTALIVQNQIIEKGLKSEDWVIAQAAGATTFVVGKVTGAPLTAPLQEKTSAVEIAVAAVPPPPLPSPPPPAPESPPPPLPEPKQEIPPPSPEPAAELSPPPSESSTEIAPPEAPLEPPDSLSSESEIAKSDLAQKTVPPIPALPPAPKTPKAVVALLTPKTPLPSPPKPEPITETPPSLPSETEKLKVPEEIIPPPPPTPPSVPTTFLGRAHARFQTWQKAITDWQWSVSHDLSGQDVLNEYADANRLARRWSSRDLGESVKIRQRGIAVGYLMGRTHPFTGIGIGQTRYFFDEYSQKVREEARRPSRFAFKQFFFRDEEVAAAPADKGIFNIFLNAWAETGAPGLIALLGILGVVTINGLKTLWYTRRVSGITPVRILLPLFLAVLAIHQTIYLWVHPWLWTIIALTYAAADLPIKTLKHESTKV